MATPIRTKRDLLERIAQGNASFEVVFTMMKVHVAAAGDPDPNGGVWLTTTRKPPYFVDDYATVFARVGGREVRLTRTETDAVVRFIAATVQRRPRALRPILPRANRRTSRRNEI